MRWGYCRALAIAATLDHDVGAARRQFTWPIRGPAWTERGNRHRHWSKPLSAWTDGMTTWRSRGGDKIRAEFEEAYAKA